MGPIRVIFLSYASDPIVTFDVSGFGRHRTVWSKIALFI